MMTARAATEECNFQIAACSSACVSGLGIRCQRLSRSLSQSRRLSTQACLPRYRDIYLHRREVFGCSHSTSALLV